MDRPERPVSNGPEAPRSHVGQRVEHLSDSAQQLYSEAKSAVSDLNDFVDLRGRVQRHPYAMLAAAAGVGYVLGGGLFTPLTGRIVRLGIRLAALPFVKEELVAMAEAAVDSLAARSGQGPTGPSAS